MRNLATIRKITDIRPIPGADRIVVAQIDGWECVVKKDEFSVGENIIYIEVDSILPERPEFEFMRERKFRVQTIKLRKQISQGLVQPLSILPQGKNYRLGEDVTKLLGIEKYDPQAAQEALLLKKAVPTGPVDRFLNRFGWYRKLIKAKRGSTKFPVWITKTDEKRIQNRATEFYSERDQKTPFLVTEKIDGQSATYYLKKINWRKYEFGVCSRNLRLPNPNNTSYWKIAKQYKIQHKLKKLIGKHQSIVLQGEIIGRNIQQNKYRVNGFDFYAFNLIYPDHHCNILEMEKKLIPLGIKTVPYLEIITLPDTIAELVEHAKGYSVLLPEQKREGIVMRSEDSSISFKVINPEFLLANPD